MDKIFELHSPREMGEILQQTQENWIRTTARWQEVLTYDPRPATGCSPKESVWSKNKANLYRYRSTSERKYRTPILMIYALINKPYVLDLTPGSSLVEYLVNEGFDVYLLDWGEFEWEDRDLGYADFVYDYIAPAAKKVARYSKSSEISIIGYCMGGTMSTLYAALFDRPRLRNLVYLAAPIDFTNAGTYDVWLKAQGYDPDRIADTMELIPKEFIDWGTRMLNPLANYWGTYTRLWKTLEEGKPVHFWKVLNKWAGDNINFPGGAYRDWIRDFYQANKLIKNQVVLRGKRVQLQRIKANILALVGLRDHIVMPHQTAAALTYLGGIDKTYLEFPVGHGGLVLGETAHDKVFPVVAEWLANRSEIWIEE
ncbi:MAG: alpha/beta fold hydrolase [Syntrophomonas sp.]